MKAGLARNQAGSRRDSRQVVRTASSAASSNVTLAGLVIVAAALKSSDGMRSHRTSSVHFGIRVLLDYHREWDTRGEYTY